MQTITYISEFLYKPNINSLKNVPLCSKRAEIICEKCRQERKREAALGKDNSLPVVLTLGIELDGSRTQNFTQKTDEPFLLFSFALVVSSSFS